VQPDVIRTERVADKVWEREWLKDFHSMRFGDRLWIVPSHEQPPFDPRAVVVKLDPGLAFGTGTHPSTALCLEWLDANLEKCAARDAGNGITVIDYGCGSGVLAVAAARLGDRQRPTVSHAFDIDPQALIATRDNAEANAVADRIVIHASNGSCQWRMWCWRTSYRTLSSLRPCSPACAPGRTPMLAGILDAQARKYAPPLRRMPPGCVRTT
jgi:ribosomal protein L11 methyltransferase